MNCEKSIKPSMTSTTKSATQKQAENFSPDNWKENDYPAQAYRGTDGRIVIDDGDDIDLLGLG